MIKSCYPSYSGMAKSDFNGLKKKKKGLFDPVNGSLTF